MIKVHEVTVQKPHLVTSVTATCAVWTGKSFWDNTIQDRSLRFLLFFDCLFQLSHLWCIVVFINGLYLLQLINYNQFHWSKTQKPSPSQQLPLIWTFGERENRCVSIVYLDFLIQDSSREDVSFWITNLRKYLARSARKWSKSVLPISSLFSFWFGDNIRGIHFADNLILHEMSVKIA